jgi:4'-phosphopantetheinyl transferase
MACSEAELTRPLCEPLALDDRRVDLWYVLPNSVRDSVFLSAYREFLSEDERAKSNRFHFERDRRRYLATRVFVRTLLSRYATVDPRAWTFRENKYGRPEIAAPAGVPKLRFNVSHTNDFIACLVGLERDLGVDVENVRRRGRIVEIADRYFSRAEVDALHRHPPHEQLARFFEYWTLKEAYIKARGMGLSIPLDQFSFHIEEGIPIRISFDPRLDDDPKSWQFQLLRPTPRHILAAGIRAGGPDLHIALKRCPSLVS